MDIDPQAVKYGFDAIKSAFETMRSLRDMFRGDPKKYEAAEQSIQLAERQVKFAEAQLAQALGYPLCKVHLPPVPMLKNRVDARYVEAIFRCPDCGAEEPSKEYFENRQHMDRQFEAHNRAISEDSWMTA